MTRRTPTSGDSWCISLSIPTTYGISAWTCPSCWGFCDQHIRLLMSRAGVVGVEIRLEIVHFPFQMFMVCLRGLLRQCSREHIFSHLLALLYAVRRPLRSSLKLTMLAGINSWRISPPYVVTQHLRSRRDVRVVNDILSLRDIAAVVNFPTLDYPVWHMLRLLVSAQLWRTSTIFVSCYLSGWCSSPSLARRVWLVGHTAIFPCFQPSWIYFHSFLFSWFVNQHLLQFLLILQENKPHGSSFYQDVWPGIIDLKDNVIGAPEVCITSCILPLSFPADTALSKLDEYTILMRKANASRCLGRMTQIDLTAPRGWLSWVMTKGVKVGLVGLRGNLIISYTTITPGCGLG